MTGQEEYPRFISNRPCGNDKYEGKSQELCMLPDISHGRNTFQTRQRKVEGGNHETAGDRYKILQVQIQGTRTPDRFTQ